MTKAKQLGIKDFPYVEKDSVGNITYRETSTGFWERFEYSFYHKEYERFDGFGWRKEYDENHVLISKIDIKTINHIKKRNEYIDNILKD